MDSVGYSSLTDLLTSDFTGLLSFSIFSVFGVVVIYYCSFLLSNLPLTLSFLLPLLLQS